ncbi:MAG: hypothetical protein ACLQPD_10565 [Desulfomonilaceae bacterium]
MEIRLSAKITPAISDGLLWSYISGLQSLANPRAGLVSNNDNELRGIKCSGSPFVRLAGSTYDNHETRNTYSALDKVFKRWCYLVDFEGNPTELRLSRKKSRCDLMLRSANQFLIGPTETGSQGL